MQRPAERIAKEIRRAIKNDCGMNIMGERLPPLIPIATLERWAELAESIDARMRLDGSPKNRRKKPTPNRRTK